jgi:hypothetical protein
MLPKFCVHVHVKDAKRKLSEVHASSKATNFNLANFGISFMTLLCAENEKLGPALEFLNFYFDFRRLGREYN